MRSPLSPLYCNENFLIISSLLSNFARFPSFLSNEKPNHKRKKLFTAKYILNASDIGLFSFAQNIVNCSYAQPMHVKNMFLSCISFVFSSYGRAIELCTIKYLKKSLVRNTTTFIVLCRVYFCDFCFVLFCFVCIDSIRQQVNFNV